MPPTQQRPLLQELKNKGIIHAFFLLSLCKNLKYYIIFLKKVHIFLKCAKNALGIVGARSVGKQLAASNEAERRNPEKPDLAKQGNAQDIKEFCKWQILCMLWKKIQIGKVAEVLLFL